VAHFKLLRALDKLKLSNFIFLRLKSSSRRRSNFEVNLKNRQVQIDVTNNIVPAPFSTNELNNNKINEGGSNQKEILFSLGNRVYISSFLLNWTMSLSKILSILTLALTLNFTY